MKRTRTQTNPIKPPDAILSSDWHLRVDTPVCRTDDFPATQWRKIGVISSLASKYDCPVIVPGDLFHHWKPSPYLLAQTMLLMPHDVRVVYGNHDLPQHNLNEANKSGIFVLETSGNLEVLPGFHWNGIPDGSPSLEIKGRKILVWHVMTYQVQVPWPGCTAPKANKILRNNPDYDLIVTGDNHTPFVEYYGEKKHDTGHRVLVNPGSITRQSAAQIEHRPRVYFYYAESNTVEPYFLPIESGAVSRDHLERNEQRDERIGAFISSVDGDWQAGLNFEENLERFFQENRIHKSIKDIVYAAVDPEED